MAASENAAASRGSEAVSKRRASECRVASRPAWLSSKHMKLGASTRTRSPNAGSTYSIPVPSEPHSHFWPDAA